ncbi:MAG: GGDEF domain-containing protein [Lachnospiraceae bacterium]|nr:GGDEF domain-containing protein [Lachnospiraceae bacterium]
MEKLREDPDSHDEAYIDILRHWQNGVYKVNLYVILLTFCIEVGFMFVLDAKGTISVPIPQYIPRYILRPTLINIVVFLTAFLVKDSNKVRPGLKAMMPLILLTVIISNLIIVHYVFCALYSLIVVPIYISAIYGDLKITKRTFCILQPVYAFDILMILLTPYKHLPEEFMYNVIVAYLIIPLSYLLVKNVVEYENKKEQLIISQARENDRLREEIKYDGLTGIYNHTGLFEYIDEKIDGYKKGDRLYICVLDIDYFKQVNDDFGHESGNLVLRELGSMMRGVSNENILPARYGGEEFTFVFSDMEEKEVLSVLEKLHSDFAKRSFEGISRKITFSAGLSAYEEGMTDQAFFEKADMALYRAKDQGRNRIEVDT